MEVPPDLPVQQKLKLTYYAAKIEEQEKPTETEAGKALRKRIITETE